MAFQANQASFPPHQEARAFRESEPAVGAVEGDPMLSLGASTREAFDGQELFGGGHESIVDWDLPTGEWP